MSDSYYNDIEDAQNANPDLAAAGINLFGIQDLETGGEIDPATAVSSTGAEGLFQILPSTAEDPGYGVTPIPESELDNPEDNAMFASDYLSGLVKNYESEGDTPSQAGAAAIQQYSGGEYNISQVDEAADNPKATFPGDGYNSPIPPGYLTGGANSGSNNQPILAGSANWIIELVERGGVILIGVALLLVGLVFMFIDAKTVKVQASSFVKQRIAA